jgi:hypothetical protein
MVDGEKIKRAGTIIGVNHLHTITGAFPVDFHHLESPRSSAEEGASIVAAKVDHCLP